MQFGLLYECQRPFEGTEIDWNALYKETLEQCELADQVGFDNLWFVEHHFLTGFSGSPSQDAIFGALSRITKQIRIGYGVCILPYHHPVRVAERVALLDQLTDGRIEVGTGRSNAYEQTGLGIDPRQTRDLWNESISMLPKIWTSDEYEYEGENWSVPKRRVLPKPYQQPHPRLYLACTSEDSFRLAAQKGIGVLSSASYAVEVLREKVQIYRDALKDCEPVGEFVTEFWGNNVHGFCDDDDDYAKELAAESMKTFFRSRQALHRGPHRRLRGVAGSLGRRSRASFRRLQSLASPVRRRTPAVGGRSRPVPGRRPRRGTGGHRPAGRQDPVRPWRHHRRQP